MPWSPVSDWRDMVNLDIEPETSDLRTNEHKEMGNHLNKEGKKYDGSDENGEDGVENLEIIPLRHLHYLFGVSEEYQSEEAEESKVSEESEESEGSEDDEGSEVSEESEDEGEEEDDEEILHFHQLHYPVDEGSEEGEGKEGEGSENDEGEEIPHFHHLHYLLDGASEEDDEEESEEWEGEENEGCEDDGVSEEWEGEEKEGCKDDGVSEVWEDEGTKENEGEDERCESPGCFIWRKTFIPHLIREEHERCEASPPPSCSKNWKWFIEEHRDEVGVDKRCEVSKIVKSVITTYIYSSDKIYKSVETTYISASDEEDEEDEFFKLACIPASDEEDEFFKSACIPASDEEDGFFKSACIPAGDKEDEFFKSACIPASDKEDEFFFKSACIPASDEEDEGCEENEQGSEDEEDEFFKSVWIPASDEEDEGCEENEQGSEDKEDEIVEGHEDRESVGDEESDISDSEIPEYKEAVYKLLKYRTYKIKGPNGQLRCPFCVGKENHQFNHLLEHAVQVAEGSNESAKQRANHFAMAKYLVVDLADYDKQLPLSANKMLRNLILEIDLRRQNMDQLQSKSEEKTMAICRILEEKDKTQHTFLEEARNMLCIARHQSKRFLEQQEMLDFDFENKRQCLNTWSEELNKREAALTQEKIKLDALMREINDHDLAKERQPNNELLEAGKELMKGLEDMPSHCRVKIGVKRRGGKIDEKAFMSACKKICLPHEAETKAVELCSFWDKKTRDLEWHPFQFVENDKGVPQEVLNENDELLRGLKDEWGDDIYSAVVAALKYNTELWNFEEDRKASHCEVIRYIFSRWKTLQCKRDEIDEVIKTLF